MRSPWALHSNEKREYLRAHSKASFFSEDLSRETVLHHRTSSRKKRTRANPLFQDRAVPTDLFPTWVAKYNARHAIIVDRLEAMREGPEKERFQSYGVRSILVFPMMSTTECLGFVGFDSVREDSVSSAEERFLGTLFTEKQTSILLRNRAENTIPELLREKEILITGTHHRVKNNFTTTVVHESMLLQ